MLKSFSKKPKLILKEGERWLETLGTCELFSIKIKSEIFHVSRVAIFRARNVMKEYIDVSVSYVEIQFIFMDKIIPRYDENHILEQR